MTGELSDLSLRALTASNLKLQRVGVQQVRVVSIVNHIGSDIMKDNNE